MARRVFHTFHYKRDSRRVSQIREMGVIEGQRLLPSNEWEAVQKRGEDAIKRWIDEQMKGRSCVVVLIGAATEGRKWVKHEIKKAWDERKGLVGVYIHGLRDPVTGQDTKGRNPFDDFTVGSKKLSSIVKAYDPPYQDSTRVYAYIKNNLEGWVEEAIKIRNNYRG